MSNRTIRPPLALEILNQFLRVHQCFVAQTKPAGVPALSRRSSEATPPVNWRFSETRTQRVRETRIQCDDANRQTTKSFTASKASKSAPRQPASVSSRSANLGRACAQHEFPHDLDFILPQRWSRDRLIILNDRSIRPKE